MNKFNSYVSESNNNESLLYGDFVIDKYRNYGIKKVIDTSITELYTATQSTEELISDLFDNYNDLSDSMELVSGSLSHTELVSLINLNTDGEALVYKDQNNEVNFNQIQNLIDISSSYSSFVEKDEFENVINVPNGGFENWTTGSLDDWIILKEDYGEILQVAGIEGNSAVRIRQTAPVTPPGLFGIASEYIFVNYGEILQIDLDVKTPRQDNLRVTVVDRRNNQDDYGYLSWVSYAVMPTVLNGDWQHYSFKFRPGRNIHGYGGVAFRIELKCTDQNFNYGKDIEVDNIRVKKVLEETDDFDTDYYGDSWIN